MNSLLIIRGPLGVGKTTVSKLLSSAIGAERISLDDIIDENNLETPDGIPLENWIKANDIVVGQLKNKEGVFILDGCFYFQEQLDDLKSKFDGEVEIFSLTSDLQTCIDRDSQREKPYGEDSAKFVHSATTAIKAGYEIDNTNKSPQEVVDTILEIRYN